MSRSKRRSATAANSTRPRTANTITIEQNAHSIRELMLVATLLVLGIGIRFAFPSRMTVEHFDEGVYASNIWFGSELGYQYPKRRFYAPPLLPSLIEWSIIIDQIATSSSPKINSLAPLAPSLFAGCVTLLLVWKMTREWFGPEAGLATLALASLSDFHALYSRTALTEALMLLFFIAAIWMLKRAFSTSNYLFLGFAGLFTGLAWWTKYNGWLPLAVGFGGLVVAFVVDVTCRRQVARLIPFWLGAVAIAFAVWSPYLRQLQFHGGYAEVAANHGQYVVGLGGWASSLSRQYANLSHFDGWATCASIGIAVLLAAATGHLARQQLMRMFVIAMGLCAASPWLGTALVMLLLSVWFVGTELYRRWFESHADDARDHFAVCFLAAWIVGLFIATPLYYPYPRLTLPWLSATWIGAGAAIGQFVVAGGRQMEGLHPGKRWAMALAFSTLALMLGIPRIAERGCPALQSRAGWLPISEQIVAEVGDRAEAARSARDEAIVIVFGEPGLFFQLNAQGTQVFVPAGDLSSISNPSRDTSIPMFLVTGPHAERTAGFQEDLAENASHLQRISEYTYVPSDLVLLNQHDPRSLTKKRASLRSESVTLYQVLHNASSKLGY